MKTAAIVIIAILIISAIVWQVIPPLFERNIEGAIETYREINEQSGTDNALAACKEEAWIDFFCLTQDVAQKARSISLQHDAGEITKEEAEQQFNGLADDSTSKCNELVIYKKQCLGGAEQWVNFTIPE
jgi:hypothetical protein